MYRRLGIVCRKPHLFVRLFIFGILLVYGCFLSMMYKFFSFLKLNKKCLLVHNLRSEKALLTTKISSWLYESSLVMLLYLNSYQTNIKQNKF